jgi:hypothetical protein
LEFVGVVALKPFSAFKSGLSRLFGSAPRMLVSVPSVPDKNGLSRPPSGPLIENCGLIVSAVALIALEPPVASLGVGWAASAGLADQSVKDETSATTAVARLRSLVAYDRCTARSSEFPVQRTTKDPVAYRKHTHDE